MTKRIRRKWARQLNYYGSLWWQPQLRHRLRVVWMLLRIHRAARREANHDGVHLMVHPEDAAEAEEITRAIPQSLQFLARHDARHYKTVTKNVKTIYLDSSASAHGNYYRLFRICVINYRNFLNQYAHKKDQLKEIDTVVWFASLLVHEGTHGRIDNFLVPYDAKNREAIERLCIKEEERFMNRIYEKGLYPKVTFKPFNPENWKKYWTD